MSRLVVLAVLLVATFVTGSSAQRGPELCFLPPDRGPCRAFVPSFYFDSSSGTCREFIYGGCQGNANRFKTQRQCLRTCV
ncbi:PI-actitoxin-Afv2b [Rhipicephalus sanguineus]|uniref:BPTI/Kunitz inhibitor domain-containing protein n=1 Tax=Rhipicephalus sanguineus TaxID=34632 RepID=A0A9D4PS53_RHISA|nr:PI-actitoxin-Afv2b [Rhipicephalus sanguineus]KAH7951349.1 hypothetical protein HPB52_008079 [Rhipicephalus sanguineus]